MFGFSFKEINVKDAYLIDNFFSGDIRGGFTKVYEKQVFADMGIEFSLSETFVSVSAKNVIRGLHFQTNKPQKKIVSVVAGCVWDVVVDLRTDSPTYRKWEGFELSAENHRGLYIPAGFAHGFAALEDGTVMLYQCDGEYDRESETGISYDDQHIGIEWPIDDRISIHSERDLLLPGLKEYEEHTMCVMSAE